MICFDLDVLCAQRPRHHAGCSPAPRRGALLITPGVLTDLFGFILIVPLTRRFLAPRIKGSVLKRFTLLGSMRAGPGPDRHDVGEPPQPPPQPPPKGRFDHPVE